MSTGAGRSVVTIGVYGFTGSSFLQALRSADVRVVHDVRQRRGVRGPAYAWANAVRLQDLLADAGVRYVHRRELAPTTALRHLQYAEDARLGVGKRSRQRLCDGYVRGYLEQVLSTADLGPLVADLPADGAGALLCVESDPEACHRSLVTDVLRHEYGVRVEHRRPS